MTTHPETGLPHLRYSNRIDTITVQTGTDDGTQPPINYDELGPVAQAWYGATTNEEGKQWMTNA